MTASPRFSDGRALLVALVLGAIAAGLTVAYLSSREDAAPTTTVATRSVVVATEDIAAGEKVTEGMLEVKTLSTDAVGSSAITDPSVAIGRTLRYPVAQGEQISSLRLVEAPKVQSLSFQIPQGMRGVTIPVNVTRSPAALVAPGDFVDVLVGVNLQSLGMRTPALISSTAPDSEVSPQDVGGVITLLQNVQVLTVQREYVDNGVVYEESVRGAPPEKDSVNYLTLALTPEQAQLMWLAVSKSTDITVTLRPFGDAEQKRLGPVTEPFPLP